MGNESENLIQRFEQQLDPADLGSSPIESRVLGYGEISVIFSLKGDESRAWKRLPLFHSRTQAEKYLSLIQEYSDLLRNAGLLVPEQSGIITEFPRRPVVLYLSQPRLDDSRFCHRLIHSLPAEEVNDLFTRIVSSIELIWRFSEEHYDIRLALDGQLSNWVVLSDDPASPLTYIDTSTALFRKEGLEQIDGELFLSSTPSFLRWIIRRFFLQEVLDRYYDIRQVFCDLAGNLHKEQKPDLIEPLLSIINATEHCRDHPLTKTEVDEYYRHDKLIWTIFLAFRRFDRLLTRRIFGKRYEFLLPDKIER